MVFSIAAALARLSFGLRRIESRSTVRVVQPLPSGRIRRAGRTAPPPPPTTWLKASDGLRGACPSGGDVDASLTVVGGGPAADFAGRCAPGIAGSVRFTGALPSPRRRAYRAHDPRPPTYHDPFRLVAEALRLPRRRRAGAGAVVADGGAVPSRGSEGRGRTPRGGAAFLGSRPSPGDAERGDSSGRTAFAGLALCESAALARSFRGDLDDRPTPFRKARAPAASRPGAVAVNAAARGAEPAGGHVT